MNGVLVAVNGAGRVTLLAAPSFYPMEDGEAQQSRYTPTASRSIRSRYAAPPPQVTE